MSPLVCDQSLLSQLLTGDLAPAVERQILAHLDSCADCQRLIERIAGDDVWWRDAPQYLSPERETIWNATIALPPSAEDEVVAEDDDAVAASITLDFLAPTDDPQSLGRLGAYEVVGLVGRGGTGVVVKAFDRTLNRFVAIKVLEPHLARNSAARQRFAREARAAAAVVHEHIVPIHAVSEHRGFPFIVMQYVSGRSLQQRLDADGPLGLREVLRVGLQTAAGLAAAHAQGLVHRDVKPANILLENGIERVLLTDFGLARTVDEASLTCSGVIAGTPQFMAPEQARGDAIDYRADLFSLGSVLYTMCTGHSPFRAETTMGVLHRICHANPRPIQATNPDIPLWMSAIIDRLHAKNPAGRYASATEVAEVLQRQLARLQSPGGSPGLSWSEALLTTRAWLAQFKGRLAWLSGVAAVVVTGAVLIARQIQSDAGPIVGTTTSRSVIDKEVSAAPKNESAQPTPASVIPSTSGLVITDPLQDSVFRQSRERLQTQLRRLHGDLHISLLPARDDVRDQIEALRERLARLRNASD